MLFVHLRFFIINNFFLSIHNYIKLTETNSYLMSSSTLFDAILQQFNTDAKCDEILNSSENHYFLKPFKIKKISYPEAKTLF